jgi:hypothetical protein
MTAAGLLPPAESPEGVLGGRGEEVDEVAVGITEQDGAISPGHERRILHPFADDRLQPLVLGVDVIDRELDDGSLVLRGLGRVVEQFRRLGVGEGEGGRRIPELGENGREPVRRDSGYPLLRVGDLCYATVA